MSRQGSINAMNEKVKKFMETADPSTASSLQAKMNDLSVRFSEASRKHKEKLAKMEELKTKVELFENLSEKLQTFLETKSQTLIEAGVPGKDVTELSQYMQVCVLGFHRAGQVYEQLRQAHLLTGRVIISHHHFIC